MKAIETIYDDHKFRSRLEARWAVFLSALGIRWKYEFEGYVLPNGDWYLPDFFLPKFDGGTWVEVKGKEFTELEKSNCWHLCNDTKKNVWLASGQPELSPFEVYYWIDAPPYVMGEMEYLMQIKPKDITECLLCAAMVLPEKL